jgi:hypothetical protein
VELGLAAAAGDAELLGDLLVAVALDVVEDEDAAAPGGSLAIARSRSMRRRGREGRAGRVSTTPSSSTVLHVARTPSVSRRLSTT